MSQTLEYLSILRGKNKFNKFFFDAMLNYKCIFLCINIIALDFYLKKIKLIQKLKMRIFIILCVFNLLQFGMGKNLDINANNRTILNDIITLMEKGKGVTFNNKVEYLFFYKLLAKLDDIDFKIGLLISIHEIPHNASSIKIVISRCTSYNEYCISSIITSPLK